MTGELVHVDIKALGKIPDGGGWRAHGRAATVDHRHKKAKVGFDYVHSRHATRCSESLRRTVRTRA